MSTNSQPVERQFIKFENGRKATYITVSDQTPIETILSSLGVDQESAAILVCGGEKINRRSWNRLTELFSRGVAKAAIEKEAIIIDRGLNKGVSKLIGLGVADRGHKTKLIGVSTSDQVTIPGITPEVVDSQGALDSNHSHFVLIAGEEDNSISARFQLAQDATNQKNLILTILAGGNSEGIALEEALITVRSGWPLVVIERSGGLANKIVRLQKYKKAVNKRKNFIWKFIDHIPQLNRLTRLTISNPQLSEIIRDGKIIIFKHGADADQLRNLIKENLAASPEDELLWMAWQRFAVYDQNSLRHRDLYFSLKNSPIILGILSTFFVLIYSAGSATPIDNEQGILWANIYNSFMSWWSIIQENLISDLIFRFLIILLPIITSIILGIETRFKLGNKYFVLRGAAEAIKRGIYSYRTLHQISPKHCRLPSSKQELSSHMIQVNEFIMKSDVNEAAFQPYNGPIPPKMYGAGADDNGFSPLDPQAYIRIRIGDQLDFYTLRTNQYEKRMRRFQIWMLIFGGISTFLAAVGAQYWLPLTAAIVSAMTAFLEYKQLQQIITKYNHTKSSLQNVRSWWQALPKPSPEIIEKDDEAKKIYYDNIQKLVLEVEAILESENQGWVEYISQAQDTNNN